MSVSVLKALVLDALYQVLDNSVFRILAVLVLIPILTTFVFGFQEDRIVFLFGLREWEYGPLLRILEQGGPISDPREVVIAALLALVFEQIAGGLGLLFCIAATAFFVPRMIEKGAADVLFPKPVSRLGFYLSRYFAGLVFVAILSTLLVGGMYLGLLLCSGHNDPGILLAAAGLTYLFALVHCVSMLIGVLTRSTVAAILLTSIFFFFNGCVIQLGWRAAEQYAARVALEDEPEEPPGAFVSGLLDVLDVAHYVLPKTQDSDVIAQKLRRSLSGPVYDDDKTGFELGRLPDSFEALDTAEYEPPVRAQAHRDTLGTLLFAARSQDGSTIELWRREKRVEEVPRSGGRVIRRSEKIQQALASLVEALEQDWNVFDLEQTNVPRLDQPERPETGPVVSFTNELVTGKRKTDGKTRAFRALIFRASLLSFTLVHEAPIGAAGPEGSQAAAKALDNFQTLVKAARFQHTRADWYTEQMAWDAELKFNLAFSVASSLCFALVMLLVGWWKLTRIDF